MLMFMQEIATECTKIYYTSAEPVFCSIIPLFTDVLGSVAFERDNKTGLDIRKIAK